MEITVNATLQDRVQGLVRNLQMLATSSGYVDTGGTIAVRHFYELWYNINMDCITAGHEDASGDLSFVARQLRTLLENFPADKTTVGILEVFPLSAPESKLLFGFYIDKLDRIAALPRTPAPA